MSGGVSENPKLSCGRVTLEIQTGDHGKCVIAYDEEINTGIAGAPQGGVFLVSLGRLERVLEFLQRAREA